MNKDKLIISQKKNQNQSIKETIQIDEQYKISDLDKSPKENGGRQGLEPTRYGDWEKNGRCIDF